MPYLYTVAHTAYANGTPMARAMLLDYQNEPAAWTHDLQYFWGPSMLVAPLTSATDSTLKIWLPPGQAWYYLWNDKLFAGGQEISFAAKAGELPVFVKAGAIIPKYEFALSTFWQKPEKLILDIYPGQSGSYILYEDDGVTEEFRHRASRQTLIEYDEARKQVRIKADKGNYTGAPTHKSYTVRLHTKAGVRNFETKLLPVDKEVVIRVK
jgi:alpha-D-xyloside xylohydrolase